jgi:2'-hydroxyisoflavone reductase
MGASFENYGGLKALCEAAAEKAMPGKTTVIRPGYIVGPGDPTDRFTYWPVRFDQGGRILVPGAPTDPLQVIDVRDLAAFMLRCAETKTLGRFNACGPKDRLPWGDVLAACKKASSAKDIDLTWIPAEKLATLKGVEFPIWAPYAGEYKGFHTVSNKRAVAAGMTFHSIQSTVSDTLAWWKTLPADRREKIARQFDAKKEAELIASLRSEAVPAGG